MSRVAAIIDRVMIHLRRTRFLAYRQAVYLMRGLEARYPVDPQVVAPAAVRAALELDPAILGPLVPDERLGADLGAGTLAPAALSSRDIFSFDDVTLPCWQESDLYLEDDWLTSPQNYPLYYALFQHLSQPDRRTRMLEIGVRTGYVGVVLARAARGPCLYLGIDPNLYVEQGLRLAAATFAAVRARLPHVEALLIEGYSWDKEVQQSLIYSGPFDLIHIDGDHSLKGKLIDLHLSQRLVAPGGVVLVDDYDHIEVIADAIRRALHLGWFHEFAYIPTKRGLGVLRRRS